MHKSLMFFMKQASIRRFICPLTGGSNLWFLRFFLPAASSLFDPRAIVAPTFLFTPDVKLLGTKARNQRGKWGESARNQRQRWRYLQVCLICKNVSMGLLYISSVELLFPRVFKLSFPKIVSFFLSGS